MKTFEIPAHYRSDLISKLKSQRKESDRMKKDFSPTKISVGNLNIFLARHFGLCYGVENAINVSFNAVAENQDKNIYLLSEIIHNPLVNEDLQKAGVRFIQDTRGNQLIPWEEINSDSIIIVPAFGTTVEIEKIIKSKKLKTEKYTSTCPFVEKVWNKAALIGKQGYSVIIHGKYSHEESQATFSHSKEDAPSLIIRGMEEAELLAAYIRGEKSRDSFYLDFKNKYSAGFDPAKDLQKLGVVNQTTMLAKETQAISNFLKTVIAEKYALTKESIKEHFADTRDTLCYATNDNQNAVNELKEVPADFALVVGGYNSSNTSHLFEILEEVVPTYYIRNEKNIMNKEDIESWNFREKQLAMMKLPVLDLSEAKNILISSGASCPDSVVESIIRKIYSLYGMKNDYEAWVSEVLS